MNFINAKISKGSMKFRMYSVNVIIYKDYHPSR